MVYTVNTKARAEQLFSQGVTAIFSDNPELYKEIDKLFPPAKGDNKPKASEEAMANDYGYYYQFPESYAKYNPEKAKWFAKNFIIPK